MPMITRSMTQKTTSMSAASMPTPTSTSLENSTKAEGKRLFVFVAKNADIAAIIRKEIKGKRESYQLIRWDMATNEFTEGQWLMNKQLCISSCSISPDGQLFGWLYNKYWTPKEPTHAGVSVIPNFTAELYSSTAPGRWLRVTFDEDSHPFDIMFHFEKRGTRSIPFSDNKPSVGSGLQEQTFTTRMGAIVSLEGYKIMLDGKLLYDAEKNVFEAKRPI